MKKVFKVRTLTVSLVVLSFLVLPLLLQTKKVKQLSETSSKNIDKSWFEGEENSLTISGSTTINEDNYDVDCRCHFPIKKEIIQDKPAVCNPTQIKIKLEQENEGATERDIKELIGSPTDLEFARVIETGFKTLDGRVPGKDLGTPGGDAGELILALTIYADMIEKSQIYLTEKMVYNILKEYLEFMNQDWFYMATDDEAIHHMEKQLGIIGLNITHPKAKQVDYLMEIIDSPDNLGDLHIKLLLIESENYSVNRTLVQYFIRSFYRILWDQKESLREKLKLDVLVGSHYESAFVEIKTDIECLKSNRASLVKVHDFTGLQVFINHIDAVNLHRAQLAKYFTQHVAHTQGTTYSSADTETMFSRMNHLGMAWLEMTGSYIAKDLPFYTVNFV